MDQAFLDLLAARQSFLLSGHENPDGDCLGAQVALLHLLRALGKRASIVNPDPVPRSHDFLLRHTEFGVHAPGAPLPRCDVAILLDCAELKRLGDLGTRIRSAGVAIAVVDHHVGSRQGDGAVFWTDAAAPSTGALVWELHRRLDVALSAPAAEGVFLSLAADTGWFRYSNTTERVLTLAGELVASGVDPSHMYDALHRRNHPASVELLARALASHRFVLEGRLAHACLDAAAMAKAQEVGFDTDAVLEPLRSVEGVEVVALFKQRGDGSIKLSLRATGAVDVQAIAAKFGGGGHVKAAGALLEPPLPGAVAAVEAAVRSALEAAAGG